MTVRQKILKLVYPLFTAVKKIRGRKQNRMNKQRVKPVHPVYSLSVSLNSGAQLPLESYRGKKILFVNTASDCGYTSQYAELQQLYLRMKEKLVIIAFPANDFGEQEKGADEEIATFCQVNFGVSFPVAQKSSVVEGPGQNAIYRWLTRKEQNGWSDQQPVWNFSKYLVDENGVLTHYFHPSISPLSDHIIEAIG